MGFAKYTNSGTSSRFGLLPDQDDEFNLDSVQRQLDNARLRLTDAGVNVDQDTDKRNWFEKLTNLPQKQNWFFDTLELIGRPGQAIMNVIDKSDKGDPLGAAWRGLSGQDRVHGSELAEKMGVDNKAAKFVLGTGIEILTDPLTYIPGAQVAKAASMAGKGVKAAGKGLYEGAERLSPQFGRWSANHIRPGAESVKDGLGYAFNRDYKVGETLDGGTDEFLRNLMQETENTRRYLNEESMSGITAAARAAGGIETGVDVGRVMEAPLKQFDDIQAFELPGGVGTTTSRRELDTMIEGRQNIIEELMRESKDKVYTPRSVDQLSVGDKAYVLGENGKRIRGSKVNEVAEIRMVNGRKEVRFVGESNFHPAATIKPAGALRQTEIGDLNQQISDSTQRLRRVENEIRKQYFSRENAALRSLAGRKNKPVNIDEVAQSRAFSQVGASPAINLLLKQREELQTQLSSLRGQADNLKQANANQIKTLEEEIADIRTSADNPVMVQREIPRPPVTLPDDPRITEAAQKLIDSNNTIRQYAADNGIGIQELEGYMKHVLSKAEREARAKGRVSSIDGGARGTGNPNKNILNQRKLTGSAEEINQQIGREFFEPNAYFATAIGQKQLIDYTQALQFRRKVLSNPNFARKYEDGMIPGKNQVIIDTNNYKFIKEGDDIPGVDQLADSIGGKYLVTKQVKQALDRYQRLTTDEGMRSMLKAYDTVLNNWKKLALLSPLYHVRNMAGAMFNNYVGGMNSANLVKYTTEGFKEVVDAVRGKESALYNEYRRQGLGAESLSNVEFLRSVDPEKQIERTVKRQSKTGKDKAISKLNLTQTSREVGDFFDQANRVALYKWARDKGMSPEKAAAKVREVQFDYTKTSPFEKEVGTRVLPFYRWMRNNIPFQLKQLVSDPKKYANMNKIRTNAQDVTGLEDETMPDYMKEQFSIPLSGDGERGKVLGLNLPLGDLTRLSDPGRLILDAVASPLKVGPELITNRSTFTDRPIKRFEGQKTGFNLPGEALDFGLDPQLVYLLEQLGGQPARLLSNSLKRDEDVDQARKFTEATLGISSPFKDYDIQKNQYYNLLEQLQELQDYMKYIEQQTGRPVRSVREIEAALR